MTQKNQVRADGMIALARAFAENAHAGQTRKGADAEPYSAHLEEVAALVARFDGSHVAVMAAWLHDTVEDCGVTRAEIATRFGDVTASVVAELTDDKTLEKPERKRMQIVNAAGKSADAALVKICDKASNVRAVGATPPVHWSQERKAAYLDWAEMVVSALPDGHDEARREFAARLVASRVALALLD